MPRISIDLTEEELEIIKYLKEKKKSTGRDIIRRALGLYGMVEQAKEEGDRLSLENPETHVKRMIISN
jgi:sporulation-control protein spo0M